VEYSTDSIVATELAQVVAIFTFPEILYESQASDSQKISSIYLVIAWLKESDSKSHKLFPYPAYVYNYDNNNYIKTRLKPYMQIINVESIYRPSFVIPVQKRGHFWATNTLQSKSELQNIPFYKVPFERSFRRYCDGFVEYIDHHLSSPDQIVEQNKIPSNVILSDYELGLVDNMIQGMGDESIDHEEEDEDNDSLNSSIADDANYDSNNEDELSTTS